MRYENINGSEIRFEEVDGEWYACLRDVCKALNIPRWKVIKTINPDYIVELAACAPPLTGITVRKSFEVFINELGIYELILRSDSDECLKFRQWTTTVLQKLRNSIGLEPYQAMDMLKPEVQKDVDYFLDALYYDEETGHVMMSVTVPGGDVDQVVFD